MIYWRKKYIFNTDVKCQLLFEQKSISVTSVLHEGLEGKNILYFSVQFRLLIFKILLLWGMMNIYAH